MIRRMRKISGKKGSLELSINFIVILVISAVIFAGGLLLAKNIFTSSSKISEQIDAQTMSRIEKLLDDGARVAIPFKSKSTVNKESVIYGIGILNVFSVKQKFIIKISFSEAFTPDNTEIILNPSNAWKDWVIYDQSPHEIEGNKKETYKVMMKPVSAEPGTYLFDADVKYNVDIDDSNTCNIITGQNCMPYEPTRKIILTVR